MNGTQIDEIHLREEIRTNHGTEDVLAPKFVINTIARGFAIGGLAYSSWKCHLRSLRFVNIVEVKPKRNMLTMYFADEDFRGINPKHDDHIVITIEVANFMVMKTMVDQDISIDILYMKTFHKMGLTQDAVVPHDK